MKIYKRDEVIWFEDGNEKFYGQKNNFAYVPISDDRLQIVIKNYPGTFDHPSGQTLRKNYPFDEITDRSGVVYGDNVEDIVDGINKGQDVNIQDQTTRPIIAKFNRVTNSTTLDGDHLREATTITVASSTGIAVGSYIIFFNPTEVKFGFATAIDISGAPDIVIDTPLDFAFPSGTFVDVAVTDLSTANGTLASPVIFGLRGTGAPPGVDLDFDLTRIIFKCTCTSAVDLTTFANFTRLINGLVFRRRNGDYENIFNVKDNGELAGIMFDFQVAAATNPAQGVDGFTGRLTFAGSSKIGVAIRLPIGDDVEILAQDDLLTAQGGETITLLEIVAEGHIVEQ